MSKPKNQSNACLANVLALIFILPFASGIVHAAEPAKPSAKGTQTVVEKPIPAPTIDTNKDGKPDAWDRDANGVPDAWDVNDDGKPDLFDDDGDGKPDDKKSTLPPAGDAQPVEQR